jgi:hypothetical protein
LVDDPATASGALNEHGSTIVWMGPPRHQAPFLEPGHDERDVARSDHDLAVEFGEGELGEGEAYERIEYAETRQRHPEAIVDRAVVALHEIVDGEKSGGDHVVLMIEVGTHALEVLH